MLTDDLYPRELTVSEKVVLGAQKAVAEACNLPFNPQRALQVLDEQKKTALHFLDNTSN